MKNYYENENRKTIARGNLKRLFINFFIICSVLSLIFSVVSCDLEVGEITSDNEMLQTETSFSDVISDKKLLTNFIKACEDISIDPNQIEDLHKVDDWISGPRYSFIYCNMAFRLYCNMDSTVNTIKLRDDIDLYKQGFEPYDVSDYIVDKSVAYKLREITENYVKSQLSYPSTANFTLFDWSYSRECDIYSVNSSVKAKNAFNVDDELSFELKYRVESDNSELIYFILDGIVLVNDLDSISIPIRKEITNDTVSEAKKSETDNSINLVDGQLGEYGRKVTLDGSEYINYYVPVGTYNVTNNGKFCTVYLAKDEYYKNSNGYMENEIVETLEFTEFGETKVVTVGNGEHLELTINGSVSLTLVE